MKKDKLEKAVATAKSETGAAIQVIWDEINRGQQKQLVKIEGVKEILDRYGVVYEED